MRGGESVSWAEIATMVIVGVVAVAWMAVVTCVCLWWKRDDRILGWKRDPRVSSETSGLEKRGSKNVERPPIL